MNTDFYTFYAIVNGQIIGVERMVDAETIRSLIWQEISENEMILDATMEHLDRTGEFNDVPEVYGDQEHTCRIVKHSWSAPAKPLSHPLTDAEFAKLSDHDQELWFENN